MLKQLPLTIWMTGLSGSGKTTLSLRLKKLLHTIRQKTILIDGDILRRGLSSDLGYSLEDRSENIRRTAHVARLMNDAGITVIVALISPLTKDRANARAIVENNHFVETYLDADLVTCEQRDPKGLYRKARSGLIDEFTGISSPYEAPVCPEVRVSTGVLTEDESAHFIFHQILKLTGARKMPYAPKNDVLQ